jgi:hypothetical protein
MAEKIDDLMQWIEFKALVLPEFQREFTWSRTQVRRLFESLFKEYPSGSLLVWETRNPPKIKNDAYDLQKFHSVKVLLDGQQRLTSLYLHIRGEVPPYYLPQEISEGYFELYFNLETGEFSYYRKMQMEGNPLWIRLSDFFKSPPTAFNLIGQLGIEDPDEISKLGPKIETNIRRLSDIKKYQYPVQTVPTDAHIREAIKVFDLINSQGTPLTQADIVLAYMTAEWPDIRREFKDKIKELEERNFSFDLTFMTRCMVGIVSGVGRLESYTDVGEKKLQQGWEKLKKALNYMVTFLRHKAYIVGEQDLNTTNVLVPLVVHIARNGWFTQANESRFLYWLYAALFKRRYSGSVETILDQDIRALLDDPNLELLIGNLKEEEGDPIVSPSNLDMRWIGHPLYNMMKIVLRANEAVDWVTGLPLVETGSGDFSIQRHHIFPTSVLETAGWDTGGNPYHYKRVHEIANRIPLTRTGNLEIFDKAPSEYLPIVEDRYPGALERSLIPHNPKLWEVENFEAFLRQRRRLIADAINDYMTTLLMEKPAEGPDVNTLIEEGETGKVEFKARLRGGGGSYHLERAVVKTVAGMLNAGGGKLLIGVADDGTVIGLDADYETLGKQNRDGFEIALSNLLAGKLGVNALPLIQIDFKSVNGREICIVTVDPSTFPVYVREGNEEQFYVRTHNATRPLNVSEAMEYVEGHFQ